MIQNFTLPASPAAARRIQELAKRVSVDVDPAIEELAKTGLVTDAEFETSPVPLSKAERQTVQFLLDCQLRGVVLSHDRHHFYAVANAVSLADAFPLVVFCCTAFGEWRFRRMGSEMGLKAVTVDKKYRPSPDHKLIILPPGVGLHAEMIRETRHGTLLMELTTFTMDGDWCPHVEVIGIDYPRTILAYNSHGNKEPVRVADMCDFMKSMLYPDGVASLVNGERRYQRELTERGFANPHPNSMAPLANVSTHLLP